MLWLLFPAWQEQNTVVVLMNFTIVQNLQAFGKNSSIETSTFLFNVTLPYFDKYFLIICEYETIIKFIKRTTVQKKVSSSSSMATPGLHPWPRIFLLMLKTYTGYVRVGKPLFKFFLQHFFLEIQFFHLEANLS